MWKRRRRLLRPNKTYSPYSCVISRPPRRLPRPPNQRLPRSSRTKPPSEETRKRRARSNTKERSSINRPGLILCLCERNKQTNICERNKQTDMCVKETSKPIYVWKKQTNRYVCERNKQINMCVNETNKPICVWKKQANRYVCECIYRSSKLRLSGRFPPANRSLPSLRRFSWWEGSSPYGRGTLRERCIDLPRFAPSFGGY